MKQVSTVNFKAVMQARNLNSPCSFIICNECLRGQWEREETGGRERGGEQDEWEEGEKLGVPDSIKRDGLLNDLWTWMCVYLRTYSMYVGEWLHECGNASFLCMSVLTLYVFLYFCQFCLCSHTKAQ